MAYNHYLRAPAPYDDDKPLYINRLRDRGSVKCYSCGKEHDLSVGDSTCDCGQDYNCVGQALSSRHEDERPYDDD